MRKKERERKRRKEKKKMREKLQLLSRFFGDRTVGSGRSKRQSWSTHRGLRVGTKFSKFRQTMRGRGLSPTRFNSCLRVVRMDEVFGAGNDRAFQSQKFGAKYWIFGDCFWIVRAWIFRTVFRQSKLNLGLFSDSPELNLWDCFGQFWD